MILLWNNDEFITRFTWVLILKNFFDACFFLAAIVSFNSSAGGYSSENSFNKVKAIEKCYVSIFIWSFVFIWHQIKPELRYSNSSAIISGFFAWLIKLNQIVYLEYFAEKIKHRKPFIQNCAFHEDGYKMWQFHCYSIAINSTKMKIWTR